MAKLTLKLNGTPVKTVHLESGKEYFAGRSSDCDFSLEDYRGISRQHLKIYEIHGVWHCESLSKFLHPTVGSENFESLEMNESVTFSLSPYQFEFELESSESSEQKSISQEEVQPQRNSLVPYESSGEESTSSGFNSEATSVGTLQLSSTLRIVYPSSSDNETLKLEGQVWTAGREPDCEIQLHHAKVSRKHFELNKNSDGYFVTDLGSSNGTYLNGQRLAPQEPTRIMSGDILRVLEVELHFEIKAANLPAVTAQPLSLVHAPWGPSANEIGPYEYDATRIMSMEDMLAAAPAQTPMEKIKNFNWKKNKVRMALIAMLPVLMIAIITSPEKKDQKDVASSSSKDANASFDNLSVEQKASIKDSLGLARNLYVQGKYSLCLAELAKLHETIPFYDNSKELESFCIQGHELTQRKLDNDRKEREKAMVEQQITDITDTCGEKFKDQGEADEIRKCLAGAIELNPEHPRVIELIQRAEDRKREKELLAQRQQELLQQKQSILSIFKLAQRYKDQGDLIKARSTYQRFLSSAGASLPAEKQVASREVASISKVLNEKIEFLLEKCRTLGESGKLKEAHKACNEVLKEDGNINEAATLKEKYANTLRREMNVIYEDSKLEESLGNLDAAKEKWKKIRGEDLEEGDFYKRATIKLRQYGAL